MRLTWVHLLASALLATGPTAAQTPSDETSAAEAAAPACTSSEDCQPEERCVSLFHQTQGSVKKTCYATCTEDGQSCALVTGGRGVCTQWDEEGLICVASAKQHEICGDARNTLCEKNLMCLQQPGLGFGVCGRLCDPESSATCQQPELFGTPFCGCLHGEVCSISPLVITATGQKGKDGLCMTRQLPGAPCGSVDAAGVFQLCPEGQICARAHAEEVPVCWSELALLDEQGRPLTKLILEDGTPFSVGQKTRPEQQLIEDFDNQCGCSSATKPCANVASILGFVWFGGCCLPSGCVR